MTFGPFLLLLCFVRCAPDRGEVDTHTHTKHVMGLELEQEKRERERKLKESLDRDSKKKKLNFCQSRAERFVLLV